MFTALCFTPTTHRLPPGFYPNFCNLRVGAAGPANKKREAGREPGPQTRKRGGSALAGRRRRAGHQTTQSGPQPRDTAPPARKCVTKPHPGLLPSSEILPALVIRASSLGLRSSFALRHSSFPLGYSARFTVPLVSTQKPCVFPEKNRNLGPTGRTEGTHCTHFRLSLYRPRRSQNLRFPREIRDFELSTLPSTGAIEVQMALIVPMLSNLKPCVFLGKYARHLNSVLSGSSHRKKLPVFTIQTAPKVPHTPKNLSTSVTHIPASQFPTHDRSTARPSRSRACIRGIGRPGSSPK